MEIKTTEQIYRGEFKEFDEETESHHGIKWVPVDDLLKYMQKLIDDRKKRHGEANAVECWYELKKKLEL